MFRVRLNLLVHNHCHHNSRNQHSLSSHQLVSKFQNKPGVKSSHANHDVQLKQKQSRLKEVAYLILFQDLPIHLENCLCQYNCKLCSGWFLLYVAATLQCRLCVLTKHCWTWTRCTSFFSIITSLHFMNSRLCLFPQQ